MYCRSTSSPFLAKMPDSRATHNERLSAIRLLYAMPIFLAGPTVGVGTLVGAAGWAAGAHAANVMPTPIRSATNDRGMVVQVINSSNGMRVAAHCPLEVRRAQIPNVTASPGAG